MNLEENFKEEHDHQNVPRKLNFNEEMYGGEEILKDIRKIASKHVKSIKIVDKIRQDEKVLGMPLLERRLMKLKSLPTSPTSQPNITPLQPPAEEAERDQRHAKRPGAAEPKAEKDGLGATSKNSAPQGSTAADERSESDESFKPQDEAVDLSPAQLKLKQHALEVKMFEDNEKDLHRLLNDDYMDVRENMRDELHIKPKNLQLRVMPLEDADDSDQSAEEQTTQEMKQIESKAAQNTRKPARPGIASNQTMNKAKAASPFARKLKELASEP